MIKIETVNTWVEETVKLTAKPHANYDSDRAVETVKEAFINAKNYDCTFAEDQNSELLKVLEKLNDVDNLVVECISLDYNDDEDETEVYTLLVSYTI